MLYQLSYASPTTRKLRRKNELCTDTQPPRAYHGTEFKVSIARDAEQTQCPLSCSSKARQSLGPNLRSALSLGNL